MASVNLQKHGTQEACSGIIRHNYRESSGHSNKDIQPELSYLNKTYGCSTGNEAREKLKRRIRELDEEHPPQRIRADRKTCLSIVIPSPREGMDPADEAAWADAAWDVLKDMFGDDLIDGVYHADEVHTYLDGGEVHKSRGHLHADVIPHTDGYGVNMKHFFTRDLPIRINEALDAKCQEMFGYKFQDGSKKKSRGSVEALKAEEVVKKREAVQQAEADLTNALYMTEEAQEALKRTEANKAAIEDDLETLQGKYNSLLGEVEATEARAQAAEARLEKAESGFSRLMSKVAEWVNSLHGLTNVLRVAVRLSDKNEAKIKRRMEQEKERGGEAITRAIDALDDVRAIMAAEDDLERSKGVLGKLKTAVKQNLNPDELEDEWERD